MATRARLPDGRLHLQHGPIDVVIGADGERDAVAAGHAAAWQRFRPLLDELVAELPLLRRPVVAGGPCPLAGPVARAMWQAAERVHGGRFLTPMAAVAGAVADTLAQAYRRPGIRRAWVNDGGDIALVLADGAAVSVGLYSDLARFDAAQWRDGPTVDGRFVVDAAQPVRGIATSGWRGRSFSLGIADSVTVLAATAALADAAATMIANAVDCEHPGIRRRPAAELKDDSDLGEIPVTVDVAPLPAAAVDAALERGLARARALQAAGHIAAAALVCQRRCRVAGFPAAGFPSAGGRIAGARIAGRLDTARPDDATLPASGAASGSASGPIPGSVRGPAPLPMPRPMPGHPTPAPFARPSR